MANVGDVVQSKRDPTKEAVFDGENWVERTRAGAPDPAGFTDLGGGMTRGPDGAMWHRGPRGGMVKVAGAPPGSTPATPKAVSGEMQARLSTGLPVAIEAQQSMFNAEKWNQPGRSPLGSNPLDGFRGALADMIDGDDNNAGWLAKTIGGQRYQDYNQAAKSYESAFMPILSGANVSPSEAARLIRADLPQRGDSPETLARKARNRALRINGGASSAGMTTPFPRTVAAGARPGARAAEPAAKANAPAVRVIHYDAEGNPVR
jgi:hypothetical protein